MKLAQFLPGSALAAAILLAGCSAIQIDVDVYKGPLANEPDIQIQQFAALAIAARPLLASLRTDIENDYRAANVSGEQRQPLETQVLPFRRLEGFLDDRVKLHSRLARFVNGALSVYEDHADPDVVAAQQALGVLRTAVDLLNVTAEDRALGRQILDRTPAAAAFAEQYRRFLCGERADACQDPVPRGPVPRGAPGMLYPKACPAQSGIVCTIDERSNAGFALLRDKAQLRKHAELLFGKVDPVFVDRVVQLGTQYDIARRSMRQVLQASLSLLGRHTPDSEPALLRAVAKAVGLSIQPAFVACMWSAARVRGQQLEPAAAALTRLWQTRQPIGEDANRALALDLENQAIRTPNELARLLLAMDHEVEIADPATLKGCNLLSSRYQDNITPDVARQYGLARGVRVEPELVRVLGELGQSLSAVDANSSGFDRARLPQGIDTLTRQYRQQVEAAGGRLDDVHVRRTLIQLQESLLFFAEQVLFVTNTLTQRALEDNLPGVEPAKVARLASRMATLQTLGNTLLLHANDLTRRRQHADQQHSAGPSELAAARSAFTPGADAAYDAFVLSAHAELRKHMGLQVAQGAAKSAADVLVDDRQQSLRTAQAARDQAAEALTAAKAEQRALAAALRSIAAPPERPGVAEAEATSPVDAVALRGQEAADRKLLETALVQLAAANSNGVPAKDFVDWLHARLSALRDEAAATTPRALRLADASGIVLKLRDRLIGAVPAAKDVAAQRAAVVAELLGLVVPTGKNVTEKQLAAERTASDAVAAQRLLEGATAQRDAREQSRADTTKAIPRVEGIRSELDSARRAVIAKAVEAGLRDPASLQRLLQDHLAAERKANPVPPAARLQALADTLAFLDGFTPPARFALDSLPGSTQAPQPRDVLDQVIASLRQQRIAATAAGQVERAKNLELAIDQAYEARQSSTFLRPASEYLKSVYSSTALAEGPQSPYQNLLLDYLKRFNPRPGDGLSDFDQRTRDAKEQAEKLFWQNINRVTVSGGGDTNTVLAKDDIGNWYVKSYSADPEAIIQSAKSLALFRAGGKVDLDLLRRADLQRKADDNTLSGGERDRARTDLATATNGPDANVGLSRVQDRLRANYDRDTAASADALRTAIVALPDALKALGAEQADLKPVAQDFDALVKSASDKHLLALQRQLQAAYDLPASNNERLNELHNAFVEGLRALRNFAREVAAASESLRAKAGATAASPKAAADLAKREAGKRIDAAATRQKAVLDSFESGLQIVGEARSSP